jgi:hypothetical protein
MEYKITEDVLVKLLDYFKQKPYVEVFQVIQYLQNLPKIEEPKGKKVKQSGS